MVAQGDRQGVPKLANGPSLQKVITVFLLHKLGLYAAACVCEPFDTSSMLLVDRPWHRLLVWDNVHFASIIQQRVNGSGPLYEHQYAFNSLWPRLISLVSTRDMSTIAICLAVGSLVSHALAVYLIYRLTTILHPRLAATAAVVYILNPGGIFLVAGYSESISAAVSFLGLILFTRKMYITSGITFGVGALLRSNGILWGILFALEMLRKWRLDIFIGGALFGLMFVYPQFEAYTTLCPGRPWCEEVIPSVYSYVQGHYWNVGLLKYWSVSQTPNFLFALPTCILLLRSNHMNPSLAMKIVQMSLLLGALFFWNVQVITRVASCLPAPTWFVAEQWQRGTLEGKLWLTHFITWTLVQAALFGAFLPPA